MPLGFFSAEKGACKLQYVADSMQEILVSAPSPRTALPVYEPSDCDVNAMYAPRETSLVVTCGKRIARELCQSWMPELNAIYERFVIPRNGTTASLLDPDGELLWFFWYMLIRVVLLFQTFVWSSAAVRLAYPPMWVGAFVTLLRIMFFSNDRADSGLGWQIGTPDLDTDSLLGGMTTITAGSGIDGNVLGGGGQDRAGRRGGDAMNARLSLNSWPPSAATGAVQSASNGATLTRANGKYIGGSSRGKRPGRFANSSMYANNSSLHNVLNNNNNNSNSNNNNGSGNGVMMNGVGSNGGRLGQSTYDNVSFAMEQLFWGLFFSLTMETPVMEWLSMMLFMVHTLRWACAPSRKLYYAALVCLTLFRNYLPLYRITISELHVMARGCRLTQLGMRHVAASYVLSLSWVLLLVEDGLFAGLRERSLGWVQSAPQRLLRLTHNHVIAFNLVEIGAFVRNCFGFVDFYFVLGIALWFTTTTLETASPLSCVNVLLLYTTVIQIVGDEWTTDCRHAARKAVMGLLVYILTYIVLSLGQSALSAAFLAGCVQAAGCVLYLVSHRERRLSSVVPYLVLWMLLTLATAVWLLHLYDTNRYYSIEYQRELRQSASKGSCCEDEFARPPTRMQVFWDELQFVVQTRAPIWLHMNTAVTGCMHLLATAFHTTTEEEVTMSYYEEERKESVATTATAATYTNAASCTPANAVRVASTSNHNKDHAYYYNGTGRTEAIYVPPSTTPSVNRSNRNEVERTRGRGGAELRHNNNSKTATHGKSSSSSLTAAPPSLVQPPVTNTSHATSRATAAAALPPPAPQRPADLYADSRNTVSMTTAVAQRGSRKASAAQSTTRSPRTTTPAETTVFETGKASERAAVTLTNMSPQMAAAAQNETTSVDKESGPRKEHATTMRRDSKAEAISEEHATRRHEMKEPARAVSASEVKEEHVTRKGSHNTPTMMEEDEETMMMKKAVGTTKGMAETTTVVIDDVEAVVQETRHAKSVEVITEGLTTHKEANAKAKKSPKVKPDTPTGPLASTTAASVAAPSVVELPAVYEIANEDPLDMPSTVSSAPTAPDSTKSETGETTATTAMQAEEEGLSEPVEEVTPPEESETVLLRPPLQVSALRRMRATREEATRPMPVGAVLANKKEGSKASKRKQKNVPETSGVATSMTTVTRKPTRHAEADAAVAQTESHTDTSSSSIVVVSAERRRKEKLEMANTSIATNATTTTTTTTAGAVEETLDGTSFSGAEAEVMMTRQPKKPHDESAHSAGSRAGSVQAKTRAKSKKATETRRTKRHHRHARTRSSSLTSSSSSSSSSTSSSSSSTSMDEDRYRAEAKSISMLLRRLRERGLSPSRIAATLLATPMRHSKRSKKILTLASYDDDEDDDMALALSRGRHGRVRGRSPARSHHSSDRSRRAMEKGEEVTQRKERREDEEKEKKEYVKEVEAVAEAPASLPTAATPAPTEATVQATVAMPVAAPAEAPLPPVTQQQPQPALVSMPHRVIEAVPASATNNNNNSSAAAGRSVSSVQQLYSLLKASGKAAQRVMGGLHGTTDTLPATPAAQPALESPSATATATVADIVPDKAVTAEAPKACEQPSPAPSAAVHSTHVASGSSEDEVAIDVAALLQMLNGHDAAATTSATAGRSGAAARSVDAVMGGRSPGTTESRSDAIIAGEFDPSLLLPLEHNNADGDGHDTMGATVVPLQTMSTLSESAVVGAELVEPATTTTLPSVLLFSADALELAPAEDDAPTSSGTRSASLEHDSTAATRVSSIAALLPPALQPVAPKTSATSRSSRKARKMTQLPAATRHAFASFANTFGKDDTTTPPTAGAGAAVHGLSDTIEKRGEVAQMSLASFEAAPHVRVTPDNSHSGSHKTTPLAAASSAPSHASPREPQSTTALISFVEASGVGPQEGDVAGVSMSRSGGPHSVPHIQQRETAKGAAAVPPSSHYQPTTPQHAAREAAKSQTERPSRRNKSRRGSNVVESPPRLSAERGEAATTQGQSLSHSSPSHSSTSVAPSQAPPPFVEEAPPTRLSAPPPFPGLPPPPLPQSAPLHVQHMQPPAPMYVSGAQGQVPMQLPMPPTQPHMQFAPMPQVQLPPGMTQPQPGQPLQIQLPPQVQSQPQSQRYLCVAMPDGKVGMCPIMVVSPGPMYVAQNRMAAAGMSVQQQQQQQQYMTTGPTLGALPSQPGVMHVQAEQPHQIQYPEQHQLHIQYPEQSHHHQQQLHPEQQHQLHIQYPDQHQVQVPRPQPTPPLPTPPRNAPPQPHPQPPVVKQQSPHQVLPPPPPPPTATNTKLPPSETSRQRTPERSCAIPLPRPRTKGGSAHH